MDLNYDDIAPGYDTHRRGRGPYFSRLMSLAASAPGRRVLEIGAGTGNNTRAFFDALSCDFTALERSAGMLARGRAKVPEAQWVQGDAMALPFPADRLDFLFGTYMLHHIRDVEGLGHECRRVLRPDGLAVFVTVPQDFIARHPMNAYFPSFAEIDLARFQPIPDVEAALRRAGFREVHSEDTIDVPRPIDAAYADRVAGQFISTYALLPSDEFEHGLARLRADIARRGRLETPIAREATLVVGRK